MGAHSGGFTLIEVVVVMAIIAILAAIAIPNYTEYIRRGHRSDAKTALLQVAQWQERFRTENNAYSPAVPAGMATVGSGGARYTIAVAQPGGNQTFTLTATRQGSQLGDPCGDFIVDHTGQQTTAGGIRPALECWAR
jgi:type IV pilus assembly protein PilE